MKKLAFLFIAPPALFFFSCQPAKNLDEFNFLTGKWQGGRDEMILEEVWSKESPDRIQGDGCVISGADTMFHEKMSIELQKGEIYYMATSPNKEGPVPFKLISYEKNSWVFENKQHDFPQKITYTHLLPDSLIAAAEGIDKGKLSHETFRFKKIE
jgi:hypothetical protein